MLRYVAGGRYELSAAVPLHPGHLMGSGMAVAGIAAIFPVLVGGTILQSAKIELVLWGFGDVKIATAIFFDIGVYLVVIGLILDILRSLGAEIDRHGEIEGMEEQDYELRPTMRAAKTPTPSRPVLSTTPVLLPRLALLWQITQRPRAPLPPPVERAASVGRAAPPAW